MSQLISTSCLLGRNKDSVHEFSIARSGQIKILWEVNVISSCIYSRLYFSFHFCVIHFLASASILAVISSIQFSAECSFHRHHHIQQIVTWYEYALWKRIHILGSPRNFSAARPSSAISVSVSSHNGEILPGIQRRGKCQVVVGCAVTSVAFPHDC